jgi:hypothetical protein
MLDCRRTCATASLWVARHVGVFYPDCAPCALYRPPLQLPESGWGYLGGGDNGQGQNANVKGVNFDPCPAGEP